MAETLSPSRAPGHRQRAPVMSPERPLFLGSNDDKMERAQARAARAAAIRRKPVASNQATDSSQTDSCLGQEQIMELFQNCIKLASENKINQKNTWELNLIDHLCDIIKVEEVNDVETNFQKASCTLEAGVRIYSMRVDSVHSEAYKVLGGISRVAQDSEQDNVEEGNNDNVQVEGTSRKQKEQKRRPLLDLSKGNESLIEQQQHNCIPDEHYVPTLLAMRGFEEELERRTLTYSLWNQSTETMNTQTWHPVTFGYATASQKNIQDIKDIDHIYFKSENRTEWCGTKSNSGHCYLFARKFSRGAAMRLLTNGLVGPYDPNTLFLDRT